MLFIIVCSRRGHTRTQHKKRAKVLLFSELTKFFFIFLQKKNFIRRFRNH